MNVPGVTCSTCRYVAEMMANRILRFFQQPSGVFHASVFYQLSGGVGPCCLALDAQGNIVVGQYDVKGTVFKIRICSYFLKCINCTSYMPHNVQRARRKAMCWY
jgi:hypothetical protein